MKLERSRGTRDFLPEEQISRQEIVDTLRTVFKLYGYPPLETPALERFEVLASKYAGGSEILKETFQLEDQGKRKLGLRYDLTVPLARIIGMNPQLKMPFKRYQIGDVWRDGPTGLARYRQFLQCDVDIVGCESMRAEAELLALTKDAFKRLGLSVLIRMNNRKVLNEVLAKFKIKNQEEIILTIDKLDKCGVAAVKEELKQKQVTDGQIQELMQMLSFSGTNQKKLAKLRALLGKSKGVSELAELLDYLSEFKVEVELDVSLARGLSYYTSTIFEVFMKRGKVESSLAAGGRYDNMIGSFIRGKPVPAVGISFGLDRIFDAVATSQASTVTQVFVIPIQTFGKSFSIAQRLRQAGLRADIDLSARGPSKNLQYANALGIPYVVFVGEAELRQNKVKLRDMKSGDEKLVTVQKCIEILTS